MIPVLVSVDKAGDLKIGRRKCRLYKKDEVVKVAKKYGIKTDKKTVGELCGAIKARAKNSPQNMNNVPLAKLYPQAAKKMAAKNSPQNMNNVPLAKLYPQAAKKMAAKKMAAKKMADKKMADKKAATNFMKGMVTNNANIAKLRQLNVKTLPKPSKKAMPLTQKEAIKRIGAMKGLSRDAKYKLVIRVKEGVMSPRRVVKVARELSKLNVAGYRVFA